jgi:hypothetical protein
VHKLELQSKIQHGEVIENIEERRQLVRFYIWIKERKSTRRLKVQDLDVNRTAEATTFVHSMSYETSWTDVAVIAR